MRELVLKQTHIMTTFRNVEGIFWQIPFSVVVVVVVRLRIRQVAEEVESCCPNHRWRPLHLVVVYGEVEMMEKFEMGRFGFDGIAVAIVSTYQKYKIKVENKTSNYMR